LWLCASSFRAPRAARWLLALAGNERDGRGVGCVVGVHGTLRHPNGGLCLWRADCRRSLARRLGPGLKVAAVAVVAQAVLTMARKLCPDAPRATVAIPVAELPIGAGVDARISTGTRLRAAVMAPSPLSAKRLRANSRWSRRWSPSRGLAPWARSGYPQDLPPGCRIRDDIRQGAPPAKPDTFMVLASDA